MNTQICVVDFHRVYRTLSIGNETKSVKAASKGVSNPIGGEKPFVAFVMTSVESALSVLRESLKEYEAQALEFLKEAKGKQDLFQAPMNLLKAQNKISKESLKVIADSFSKASKEMDEANCANPQLKPALQKTLGDVKSVLKDGRTRAFQVLNTVSFKPNLTAAQYQTEIDKSGSILKESVLKAIAEVDKFLKQFAKDECSVVCHLLSKKRVWIELKGEEFNLRTDAPLNTFPERTEVIIGDGIDQLRMVVKRDNANLVKAKLSPIPFLEKEPREKLVTEFKTLFDVKCGLKFDENAFIQSIVSVLSQPAEYCNFYEVLKIFNDHEADLPLTAEQKKSIYEALLSALSKTEAVNKEALIFLLSKTAKKDSKLKSQWYRWYVWKAEVHYGEILSKKHTVPANGLLNEWKEYPISTFVEPEFLDSDEKRRIRELEEKRLFLKNELQQKNAQVQELKMHKQELVQRLKNIK